MEKKICVECKQVLPIEAFRLHKKKYRLNRCKKCDNRKIKQNYLARRKKLVQQLNTLKLQYGCCICGYQQFVTALDFHHLEEAKKEHTISKMLSWGGHSISSILKEVSKCVVVCANCHRALHHEELQLPHDIIPLNLENLQPKPKKDNSDYIKSQARDSSVKAAARYSGS